MSGPVDLSIRQFVDAWREMCGRHPGHVVANAGGAHYVFSGIPIAFFNVVVLDGSGISADVLKSHAEKACAWAAARDVPWLFVVTHEKLTPGTDAAAVLDGCGLAPLMPLTGMFANRLAPGARSPEGLRLVVPQDDGGCSTLVDVNARAYGMDLDASKAMIGKRTFWKNHFPVLGTVDGAPVSCAAVLMVDGCRYVALVATAPDRQKKGFADAAMRRALELAAKEHGERPTVLHATEAGRPSYERMGYEVISTHTVFMERKFLEAH